MSVAFFFSAFLAVVFVGYLIYPLFAADACASQKVKNEAIHLATDMEKRREDLFSEVEYEFTTGKISEESYDEAKRDIEKLTAL